MWRRCRSDASEGVTFRLSFCGELTRAKGFVPRERALIRTHPVVAQDGYAFHKQRAKPATLLSAIGLARDAISSEPAEDVRISP